jgi:hypothetical protein
MYVMIRQLIVTSPKTLCISIRSFNRCMRSSLFWDVVQRRLVATDVSGKVMIDQYRK